MTKWTIDPGHSELQFKIRHLAITNVVGKFRAFQGVVTGADFASAAVKGFTGAGGEGFAGATVEASIEAGSIDTNNPQRDGHLKSGDFLDVEQFPTLSFSGRLNEEGEGFVLVGQLTIKGASQPIRWKVEHTGVATGRFGDVRAGFEISAKINRKDFGLSWNILADGGGLVLGEEIALQLDVQVVKQAD